MIFHRQIKRLAGFKWDYTQRYSDYKDEKQDQGAIQVQVSKLVNIPTIDDIRFRSYDRHKLFVAYNLHTPAFFAKRGKCKNILMKSIYYELRS